MEFAKHLELGKIQFYVEMIAGNFVHLLINNKLAH